MSVASRPRLSAEERRHELLAAASRVFARSSYRGATTAEIAREAGVTEPILYRHFASKRDLYLACLDDALGSFREAAERALAEDPDGCLGAIVDEYVAKRARTRLVDLWIQALNEAGDDPVIAKALRAQIRDVHAFVVDVIERGQRAGTLNAERDAVAEAWLFVAGGLLATIDQRLGGLLGADLERVRASRRDYMHP